MSRFRRFLHLEKDRASEDRPHSDPLGQGFEDVAPAPPEPAAPEPARPEPQSAPRFSRPGMPVIEPPDRPVPTGASLDRFAAAGDDVVRTDPEPRRPMLGSRCFRCEREFGRFDTECQTCGNPLNSAEQVEFTERLAAERAVFVEQERLELEALKAQRSHDEDDRRRTLAEAQRGLGRELARREVFGEIGDAWTEPAPYPARRWLAGVVPPAQRGVFRLIALAMAGGWLVGGIFGGGPLGWRALWLGMAAALVWAFFPRFWRRSGDG